LDTPDGISCCLFAADVNVNGKPVTVCLIRETEPHIPESDSHREQSFDVVAAVEAAVADTSSWFARIVIEKLNALRLTTLLVPRSSDLDVLTDREREVLALICEGRSDAQMGTMLTLSQNTVRNHIASLYRKIGVNRRSAAIIWARERGITAQDAREVRRSRRPNSLQR
jgi:DNA-binding CsgD family transcriptional regulator